MVMVKVIATKEMIKCTNLEKKKEKQKPMEIKAKVFLRVLVLVITFIIDSRTIKRGNLWLNGLSSATR